MGFLDNWFIQKEKKEKKGTIQAYTTDTHIIAKNLCISHIRMLTHNFPHVWQDNAYYIHRDWANYFNSIFGTDFTPIPKEKINTDNLVFHPLAKPHQIELTKKCIQDKRHSPNLDTGGGKTLLGLMIIDNLFKMGRIKKPLVICPLYLIETSWSDDLKKFSYDKDYEIINLHKLYYRSAKGKREVVEKLNSDKKYIFMLNYESIGNLKLLLMPYIDLVIFDEADYLQNWYTQNTKNSIEIAWYPNVEFCYTMSGTPYPNGFQNCWGQMECINKGLLGSYTADFEPLFFNKTYGFKFKDKRREILLRKILHKHATYKKKEEILPDLPKHSKVKLYCEMTKRQQQLYNKVKKSLYKIYKEIEFDGDTVKISNFFVQLLKLRQITSGFLIMDNDHKKIKQNPKKLLLENFLKSNYDRQLLIWTNYVMEMSIVKDLVGRTNAGYIWGGASQESRQEAAEKFANNKIQYLVINIKAGQYGYNFQAYCYQNFFFSLLDSYKDFHQASSRVDRFGQTKPVVSYFPYIKGTVDDLLWGIMQRKKRIRDLSFEEIVASLEFEKIIKRPKKRRKNNVCNYKR